MVGDGSIEGLNDWEVVARNLPEHGGNAIHTDAGAQAAGFPRALVAGVTTYAYLTRPVMAGWGAEWLAHGGAEVRFRHPVFADDVVRCVVRRDTAEDAGGVVVEARSGDGTDQPRAALRPWRAAGAPPPLRPGEPLRPWSVVLDGRWGVEHGARVGDDLAIYVERRLVHPAVWPSLANQVVHAQVARGSWIHVRSIVRHHRLVEVGAAATVDGVVVARAQRRTGEHAVLDVRITVDDQPVVTIEHEVIVALT